VIPLGQPKGPSGKPKAKSTLGSTLPAPDMRLAAAPRKSRVGKVLGILSVVTIFLVLLVVGGLFLWWQHYKTTPAYSLAVLIDAAQRQDTSTVESIIDMNQVATNFAGEVSDRAASRYGMALGGNARQQVAALAPKLLPRIKDSVSAALTTRIQQLSTSTNRKPFLLTALGVPYVMNIAENGNTAKATAQVQNRSLQLDLSRVENGWKVVAFHDEELVQQAIDQVVSELPAIGVGGPGKKTDPGRVLLPHGPIRIP